MELACARYRLYCSKRACIAASVLVLQQACIADLHNIIDQLHIQYYTASTSGGTIESLMVIFQASRRPIMLYYISNVRAMRSAGIVRSDRWHIGCSRVSQSDEAFSVCTRCHPYEGTCVTIRCMDHVACMVIAVSVIAIIAGTYRTCTYTGPSYPCWRHALMMLQQSRLNDKIEL